MSIHPESEFTASRPDCPHPERWSAPDTDSTECEVSDLVGAFVRALKPDYVVETGSAFGFTTAAIGRALKMNGVGRAVSLEVDPERVALTQARLELAECDELVEVRQQSSLDFIPEQPIGFAWFDSLFELRMREFTRYRGLGFLKPGAVVGFHDAGPHYPVRGDVEALESAGWLRAIFLPTPRGVAFGTVL